MLPWVSWPFENITLIWRGAENQAAKVKNLQGARIHLVQTCTYFFCFILATIFRHSYKHVFTICFYNFEYLENNLTHPLSYPIQPCVTKGYQGFHVLQKELPGTVEYLIFFSFMLPFHNNEAPCQRSSESQNFLGWQIIIIGSAEKSLLHGSVVIVASHALCSVSSISVLDSDNGGQWINKWAFALVTKVLEVRERFCWFGISIMGCCVHIYVRLYRVSHMLPFIIS